MLFFFQLWFCYCTNSVDIYINFQQLKEDQQETGKNVLVLVKTQAVKVA